MTETIIDIETPDGIMGVLAKRPDDVNVYPPVVLFHDGLGIREAIHENARHLAASGFCVLAPDRYYRKGRFYHVEALQLKKAGRDSELMQEFYSIATSVTDTQTAMDWNAILQTISSDPLTSGHVRCMGYCNGARAVIIGMLQFPDVVKAGVALHPSFIVSHTDGSLPFDISAIKGSVYFAFGAADHLSSIAHNRHLINGLSQLGHRATIEYLQEAGHGFAVPGPDFDNAAYMHSFRKATDLFKTTAANL